MPCGCEARFWREEPAPVCPTCTASSALVAKLRDPSGAKVYRWRCANGHVFHGDGS